MNLKIQSSIDSEINNYKGLLIITIDRTINEVGLNSKQFYQILYQGRLIMNTKYENIIMYQEVFIKSNCIINRGEVFAINSLRLSAYFKIYKNESNKK